MNVTLKQLLELVPTYVTDIAQELHKNNYEAYLVGGCLRDILLGRVPEDYDIATNAYPEEIIKIFPKSIPTGMKFGTITVVGQDSTGENFAVEVTTYRSEADYFGGRWPAKVEFTKTIDEDLARRDFTINAMALDLVHLVGPAAAEALATETSQDDAQLVNKLIVDPFNGLHDLDAKVIRAVGNPNERFTEDGLRPVRGCRLASQLEFTIDPATQAAMKETNHITKHISVERFRDELMKLLLKSPKPSVGLRLMKDTGILALFIPELLEGVDVTQPEFHVDDVFNHLMATVDVAVDRVKLAALFHDIAKPCCYSKDEKGVHFYGHDMMGAEMTKEIMTRLKFSNAEIERNVNLVRWHMFYYPSMEWRRVERPNLDIRNANKDEIKDHLEKTRDKTVMGGWSDSAIRRLMVNVGGQEAIDDLLQLRIADAAANPKSEFNPEEIDVIASRIADVRAKEMALKISDLDVTGHDLMQELGIQPGPKLGEVLQYLLDQVIEDPNLNRKEELMKLAQDFLAKN